MIATLPRLAFAGIRSRVLASTLLVLLGAGATAVIVLALQVRSTLADPWSRTFDAAHGAHVLANVASEADALAVASLPGVRESSAPIPIARVSMVVDGTRRYVFLAGLAGPPDVNAPVLTDGSGPWDGGILFERSLARALGIAPGEEVEFETTAGSVPLRATGTAVSPAQARYPRSTPGLAWVTRSDLERIMPDRDSWRWMQGVRLADPTVAATFANIATADLPPASAGMETWQAQRDNALMDADPARIILTAYAVLLLLVSVAVVAILVGARVSSQHREIGLLKAIGLTPGQVSVIFVLEATCLALAGVLAGSLPAILLAPRLVAPTAATFAGSPEVTADPRNLLIAGVVVVSVVGFGALLATRRSTRASVLQALRAGTGVQASRSPLARLIGASGLPIPVLLGLRDMLARRMRVMWLMAAVGAMSATMVVTLSITAALNARPAGEPSDVPAELPALILTLNAVLVGITLSALVSVTLIAVQERMRDFGVLRTVGLTPNEVTLSLAGPNVVLALVSACLSVPAGIVLFFALYAAASGDGNPTEGLPAWWAIAAIPIGISIATAIVTGIPARVANRTAVAGAVRIE